MGVVRIDDELLEKVKKWIKENGNKYHCPNISTFVNTAVYEKLQRSNAITKRREGKKR